MIDDSPEFHKIEPTSLIVKIGKKWNCMGDCWTTIDTEQWRDPNSVKKLKTSLWGELCLHPPRNFLGEISTFVKKIDVKKLEKMTFFLLLFFY